MCSIGQSLIMFLYYSHISKFITKIDYCNSVTLKLLGLPSRIKFCASDDHGNRQCSACVILCEGRSWATAWSVSRSVITRPSVRSMPTHNTSCFMAPFGPNSSSGQSPSRSRPKAWSRCISFGICRCRLIWCQAGIREDGGGGQLEVWNSEGLESGAQMEQ